MTEPKPCPVCGERPTVDDPSNDDPPVAALVVVMCGGETICLGCSGDSAEEAVQTWNNHPAQLAYERGRREENEACAKVCEEVRARQQDNFADEADECSKQVFRYAVGLLSETAHRIRSRLTAPTSEGEGRDG